MEESFFDRLALYKDTEVKYIVQQFAVFTFMEFY